MNTRYFSKLPRWLALLAMSLGVTAAHAQTAPVAPPMTEKAPTAQVAPAPYQSALDGYKPYTEEKTGNWKEANDLSARIGGWRAYAKEAAQGETDPRAGQRKPTQGKP